MSNTYKQHKDLYCWVRCTADQTTTAMTETAESPQLPDIKADFAALADSESDTEDDGEGATTVDVSNTLQAILEAPEAHLLRPLTSDGEQSRDILAPVRDAVAQLEQTHVDGAVVRPCPRAAFLQLEWRYMRGTGSHNSISFGGGAAAVHVFDARGAGSACVRALAVGILGAFEASEDSWVRQLITRQAMDAMRGKASALPSGNKPGVSVRVRSGKSGLDLSIRRDVGKQPQPNKDEHMVCTAKIHNQRFVDGTEVKEPGKKAGASAYLAWLRSHNVAYPIVDVNFALDSLRSAVRALSSGTGELAESTNAAAAALSYAVAAFTCAMRGMERAPAQHMKSKCRGIWGHCIDATVASLEDVGSKAAREAVCARRASALIKVCNEYLSIATSGTRLDVVISLAGTCVAITSADGTQTRASETPSPTFYLGGLAAHLALAEASWPHFNSNLVVVQDFPPGAESGALAMLHLFVQRNEACSAIMAATSVVQEAEQAGLLVRPSELEGPCELPCFEVPAAAPGEAVESSSHRHAAGAA